MLDRLKLRQALSFGTTITLILVDGLISLVVERQTHHIEPANRYKQILTNMIQL